MKNNNVLNSRELHNPGIGLKDIKNWQTTSVNPVCFGSVKFPFRKNYFVFLVNSKGFCKPNYSVFSNPYTAVICARLACKKFSYLSNFHVEIVRFDPSRCRHISYISGHGEPVEDIFLHF